MPQIQQPLAASSPTSPNHRSTKRRASALTGALVTAGLLLAGCSTTPSIAGVWQPDDGTGVKTIRADGTCTGMYYNHGRPLDIGNVATCQLSSSPGDDGTYTLVVEQAPNQASYAVRFDGDDQMTVDFGSTPVTLKRQ
jgi:hypothetical protein